MTAAAIPLLSRTIGSIGKIAFLVSAREIFTFRNLTRRREARYASHGVINGRPRLQHTGRELDTASLEIVFDNSVLARTSIDRRIASLLDMAGEGDKQPLVFGTDYWGEWVLLSVDVEHKEIHFGRTVRASVKLELKEYN